MKRTKLLIELATQKSEIEKNSVSNIENSPKSKYLPHIYKLKQTKLLIPRVRTFDWLFGLVLNLFKFYANVCYITERGKSKLTDLHEQRLL